MFGRHNLAVSSVTATWVLLLAVCSLCPTAAADEIEWIPYTTDYGVLWFDNLRKPSLYTGSYGDCQGSSLVDLTRFDAALYKDNMTVMIHVQGTTKLQNEHVILGVSVYAYGETRLNMMINPCTIDAPTLCPVRESMPITLSGMLPIGAEDLAGVPDIAYSIPDFEGQAILRLYSGDNQTQLACYAASMTNGNTFSQPGAIGTVLGLFTLASLVSSVAMTVYGQVVPEMRIHYAHTVSIFMVFSVFQHIYFTGALSVNWPSVLPAFWSNFAWAAGMLHVESMQTSINSFAKNKFGNISVIGGTPNNANYSNLGGKYDGAQLLQNTRFGGVNARASALLARHLVRRANAIEDRSTGFTWYGDRVAPGLPLPGNYSGLAGTLAQVSIPASNAFLTGFIWLLILSLIMLSSIAVMKLTIEICVARKWTAPDRWQLFRLHWLKFTAIAMLRMCYIAFFMVTILAFFQFVLGGAAGSIGLAAVLLIVLISVLSGFSAYALWSRLRSEELRGESSRVQIVSRRRGIGFTRANTTRPKTNEERVLGSFPWLHLHFVDPDARPHVHDDVEFTANFGWLTARYRRSKWWFFALWLFYEFIRACFYGAAAGHALVQIFGLLVWEIIAFVTVIIVKPFESNRSNLVMVYLLGFSKVATTALSLAFDPRFALGRILTTVIGVMIIVIQGLLTICLLVTMAIGLASSYMSLKRHEDNSEFRPRRWVDYRLRYFAHIRQKATDQPVPQRIVTTVPTDPKAPTFAVSAVRRQPKIEDESEKVIELTPVRNLGAPDQDSLASLAISRPASIRSYGSNVPFGARLHRSSWSAKDLASMDRHRDSLGPLSRGSMESIANVATRNRSASLRDRATRPMSIDSAHGLRRAKRWSSTIPMPHKSVDSRSFPAGKREMGCRATDSDEWATDEWSPDDVLPNSFLP